MFIPFFILLIELQTIGLGCLLWQSASLPHETPPDKKVRGQQRRKAKEKIYYQKKLIDIKNQEIKYSRNEKFIYKYEKNYILILSLKYH